MNVLLVVSSYHHRNTEKIAGVFARVFDARMKTPRQTDKEELRDFDLVGFGSGIDSDKHYAELLDLAETLPRVADRKAFIFSTCGMPVFVAGKKLRCCLRREKSLGAQGEAHVPGLHGGR